MHDRALVADALNAIIVRKGERDYWARLGMSVKACLGDDGFDIWDEWSARNDGYSAQSAKATWRSIKAYGGIGPGTLFAEAKSNGWQRVLTRDEVRRLEASQADHEAKAKANKDAEELAYKKAALEAESIIRKGRLQQHEYLMKKGFYDQFAIVLPDGRMVVPIRSYTDYPKLQSLQYIKPDGDKKMLYGGRAKGGIMILGDVRSATVGFCEGYATGLSLQAALKAIFQPVQVWVCFSAHNMQQVASKSGRRGFIVADNDASQTGALAAAATGLPWWMPPDVGDDVNDFHAKYGLSNLARKIGELRARA